MRLTEKEAIQIAKNYKKNYSNLTNEPIKAQFNEKYIDNSKPAWIVTGVFELFGDIKEFTYIISDETGKVEYTISPHGTINPHLEIPMSEEWEKYTEDDLEN